MEKIIANTVCGIIFKENIKKQKVIHYHSVETLQFTIEFCNSNYGAYQIDKLTPALFDL
jgi:hypothetical protein